jgi:hypothetical protein
MIRQPGCFAVLVPLAAGLLAFLDGHEAKAEFDMS